MSINNSILEQFRNMVKKRQKAISNIQLEMLPETQTAPKNISNIQLEILRETETNPTEELKHRHAKKGFANDSYRRPEPRSRFQPY